jgi:hypothetical protein
MRSLGLSLVAVLAVAACDQSAFDGPNADEPPPGPGSPTWADTDLSCSTTSDCSPGESCVDGTCRPATCADGSFDSDAPLGPSRLLFKDEEMFIIDATASQGQYWVDGYDAAGAITYGGAAGGSTKISTASLTDVARIHTADGGAMLVSVSGSKSVTITGRAVATKTVNVDIVPVAVASGDIDGDMSDEIVALSADGKIAICEQSGDCQQYSFGNGERGADVAVGDLDGDGFAEIVFLLRTGDSTTVAVWTVASNAFNAMSYDAHFERLATGDVDKDGKAEVLVLEDRGWYGLAQDKINIYRGTNLMGVTALYTTGRAVDVSSGDIDASETDAIVVLGSNKQVDVMRWDGSSFVGIIRGSADTTASPTRIALGDYDDDSVVAHLKSSTPTLMSGTVMPIAVIQFPPYDSTASNGNSGVHFGSHTNMGEDLNQWVSLNGGIEAGVDVSFLGIFKGRVGARVGFDVNHGRNMNKRSGVGTGFGLRPQPELYGSQYAAVVVACNCFHTYEYTFTDPKNRMSANGHSMALVVPVGGKTTVLSTPRYNALASAVGGLPQISITNRIGDPSSYPTSPKKLDGTPVQADEQVFTNRPILRVSDVASVDFGLEVGSGETNSRAMSINVDVHASLGAFGYSAGVNLGSAWGKSYAITVGQDTSFGGDVSPIPDKSNTPEDEYQTHAYTFEPYVYTMPYTNPTEGTQTGYYVLDYAVTR